MTLVEIRRHRVAFVLRARVIQSNERTRPFIPSLALLCRRWLSQLYLQHPTRCRILHEAPLP